MRRLLDSNTTPASQRALAVTASVTIYIAVLLLVLELAGVMP